MSVRTFITDLQNADSSRKFRWLIGLTIATMAIIIGLWLLASPTGFGPSAAAAAKEDQPTFWEKIAISTGQIRDTLREKTANTINYFTNKFGKTNTIEVKTENNVN